MAELIRDRFGIKLPLRPTGRWGLMPRQPMGKAYEQSLAQPCPAIAACAKVAGAEIHWGNEAGLRSDDLRGRSLAPQGQAPVVRVNMRHGLSILSTVTHQGTMRWKMFDGALNADMLIDVMKRLVRDVGCKVCLILEIEVLRLPAYRSELIPNELADADLKQAATKPAPARASGSSSRQRPGSAACSASASASSATSSMSPFGMPPEFDTSALDR